MVKYLQGIPRISKLVLAVSLAIVILTTISLGKSIGLMLVCVAVIASGMVMLLKSKDPALKVGGGVLFTVGLLWLLLSPLWLRSGLPLLDPFATPVSSLMPPQ